MLIPRELKRNLSRFERELVNRRQMIGLGIVLYAVLLIPFSKFPNGWVRVIPFLGRPVRGSSFSYHTAL